MPRLHPGCNITIETRDEAVVRLRPRPNIDVNRHFMCDTGRLDYRWLNYGDRAEAPLLRDGEARRPPTGMSPCNGCTRWCTTRPDRWWC